MEINFEIIGAGSNFLVRDKGFDGIIIKLGKKFNKLKFLNLKDTLNVGLQGLLDINLAKFALKNNIKNFEFYSGIPGTIGGAIKMNAGCYGSQKLQIISKRILVINNGVRKNKIFNKR